jgi:4-amino-4-deoxychorismate lyase
MTMMPTRCASSRVAHRRAPPRRRRFIPIASSLERVDAATYASRVASRILRHNVDGDAVMPGAVYDSTLACVARVRDVRSCVVSIHDRGFHRGAGAFDAATIVDGTAHLLESHAARLARNCRAGGLCAKDVDVEALTRVVRETIEVSEVRFGQVRVYATSGSDGVNFSLCDAAGDRDDADVFVVAYEKKLPTCAASGDADDAGLSAFVSDVPIKHPRFARMKTVNYLNNVLLARDARDRGVDVGVFATSDECVGEAPGANLAFLTADGTLATPARDDVLAGITIARVMELAEKEENAVALAAVGVRRIEDAARVSPDVPLAARECMLVGSAANVQGITSWNGNVVGDGRVGPATKLLARLLLSDMFAGTQRLERPMVF